MPTYQCALVGSHFRPPAKLILATLASGTPLRLQAEPGNQYDADAVKVWVSPEEIPASQRDGLREALPGAGFDLDELLAGGEIWLGYLGASAKLIEPGQVGNGVVAEALRQGKAVRAALTTSVSGKASVLVKVGENELCPI